MKNRFILLSITLVFLTCKSPSYLSEPKNFQNNVNGLYFECQIEGKEKVIGEIIEVDPDALKLLLINGDLITLSKNQIETGDILVALTSDNPKKIKTWSTINNVLVLGHGFWAVLTLPVNLASTIPMSYSASKGVYRVNYPKNVYWENLSKFARFPQGIPAGIDLKSIE